MTTRAGLPHRRASGGRRLRGADAHLGGRDGARRVRGDAGRAVGGRGGAAAGRPRLHPFYKDLAVRFAEAGLPAVAMDYFGRTAGTAPRGDDFEFRSHVDATTPEQIAADAAAAVVAAKETGATRVYTVGFCFGGSQSWRLAASDIGLSGVVGFYGKPAMARDLVGAMHLPMLLLVAGADAATPAAEFAAFDAQLIEAGVPHETTVYEGAPHSFFDRSFADWHDAGQDAWRRILTFAT